MIVYLNGSYLDGDEAKVPLLDGGYLYGDGIFETLRIYQGRPFDLNGHLDRLNRQLELLSFAWRPEPSTIATIIKELVGRNNLPQGDARCRLTVSRGVHANAILPLDSLGDIEPTVSMIVAPVGEELTRQQTSGVAVSSMPLNSARGNFPLLKTLNCLPTVMALRAAQAAGCDEALLVDGKGRVLEGATSNVFLLAGRRLITPPTDFGLLPGRTRSMVLEIARESALEVVEEAFSVAELQDADEVFLSGSVKEILPVISIDGCTISDGAPGETTHALWKKYRRGVRDTLGDQKGTV